MLSDTINVALTTTGYTPDRAAHDFWDDVVAYEHANSGNYVTNGKTLGAKTLGITGNVIKFTDTGDSGTVVWTSSTISAYQAIIHDRTPASDATRGLCGYVDFGGVVSSSNGSFTITWSASGIFTITMS